jgi:hypothetical protein
MNYTYIDLGNGLYEVKVNTILFILDIQDPTQASMVNDFNTDPSKLEYFATLLYENPNTAYSIYNNM